MFSAINLKEGGEPEYECSTERGLVTQRSLVTHSEKTQQQVTSFAQVMRKEARLRLTIEEMSTVNDRFATVFTGLKLNQPHNSAVSLTFAFLVRRLIFAMAIVLMSHLPQMATLITMLLSVCMLGLLLVE